MMILTGFVLISIISQAFSISNDLQDDFLLAHNNFRRQVAQGKVQGQPAAGDMMEMVWSDELAVAAEKWASRCVFEHDGNRQTKSFPVTGQNIYAGWEPKDATKLWFNEHRDYTYNNDQCHGGCGHYTQVVWADSNYVGCASAHCENVKEFGYKYFVVCNYGPAGNYQFQKPYSAGESCSKCPSDSICNEGLCSNDHVTDKNDKN